MHTATNMYVFVGMKGIRNCLAKIGLICQMRNCLMSSSAYQLICLLVNKHFRKFAEIYNRGNWENCLSHKKTILNAAQSLLVLVVCLFYVKIMKNGSHKLLWNKILLSYLKQITHAPSLTYSQSHGMCYGKADCMSDIFIPAYRNLY